MSSLNESAAGHNVTSRRHEGEPRRGRGDVGICVAVGISMVALAAGTPTRVLGDQPSKVSRAQNATPTLFLLANLKVEAAERTKLFWFVGTPRQRETAVAALSKVKPPAMAGPRLQKVEEGPRQDTFVTPAPPPPQRPPAPAVVAPLALNAEVGVATRFDVSVGGSPEDLRPGTVVRVSGLPRGATLSGGQANADRGWVVPLWALDDLKIRVSPDVSGDFDLVVALVDNNGATLAERSVALRINPSVAGVPRDLASPSKTTVAAPAPTEALRRVLRAKGNDLPVSSARRHSALKLRLKRPPGTTSDMPSGRDDLKRSRVTDARNAKSGPCLLELRFYSPKVLWHIGECRDAAGR
jgi:hypothetical protein